MHVPTIQIYSSASCAYCVAAKNFIKQRGLAYEEIRVDLDAERRREMLERSRRTSVPQIFVDGVHVGGYQDMVAKVRSGELSLEAG